MAVFYEVDSTDRLVAVDEGWDLFALENDAPHLTRTHVIGRPLLSFISGLEAREVTRLILAGARSGGALELDFRCDSPHLRRFMRLGARALPGGGVAFQSHVLREEPRPPVPILDPTVPRTNGLLVVCSWCKKIQVSPDTWGELEEAARALGFLLQEAMPGISHGICPVCLRAVRATLARKDPKGA